MSACSGSLVVPAGIGGTASTGVPFATHIGTQTYSIPGPLIGRARARNTTGSNYLIDFPSQVITTDCAASPGVGDYVSGARTLYDGSSTLGAAPTQGLPTQINEARWPWA